MNFLPFSTVYDPAEDPPGSVDPLGTLSEAERLADILLPGFTVRMWRPRLLTFTAIASVIADRVVRLTGREEDRFRKALAENFGGAYRRVTFAVVDWSPERRFIGPFEHAFSDLPSQREKERP